MKITGIDIGGKTKEEVREIIEEKWNNFIKQDVSFEINQGKYINSPYGFGFQIDLQKTVNFAEQIGKESSLIKRIKEQISSLFGKYDLNIHYTSDMEQFQKKFDEVFENVEKPVQDATLIFEEEFILQPAIEGIAINKEKLLNDLSNNIKSLSNQQISLQIFFDLPSITDAEVSSAKEEAERIIGSAPFKIYFEDNVWTIKESVLSEWIDFKPTIEGNTENYILGAFLNKDKIEKYLAKIAWATNQPVLDAKLVIEDNRAIEFSIPQEGFGVQSDKTANNLMTNILVGVKETELLVGKTSPKGALSETNDLGINELIGQGKSNFAGSPSNRIHNIKTGAGKFNGLILAPDEEFSFNELLGGSGEEQGFLAELVIKEGELILEYGGGLCQVSTTLFRAAINSGLTIVERKAHAFPITYYAPHGFDATVYEPRPDFRFLNDTSNHLLIQSIVEGNRLTFNFYGTAGRTAEIIGPTILEQEEDGSMKTILTQKIYQDGILVRSENFISDYDSPDNYEKVEE